MEGKGRGSTIEAISDSVNAAWTVPAGCLRTTDIKHGESQRFASSTTIPRGLPEPKHNVDMPRIHSNIHQRWAFVHLGNGTRTQECTHVHGKTLRRDAGAVRQDELTLDEVRQFAGIGDEVTEATTWLS